MVYRGIRQNPRKFSIQPEQSDPASRASLILMVETQKFAKLMPTRRYEEETTISAPSGLKKKNAGKLLEMHQSLC